VKESLSRTNPGVVREIFRLLAESKKRAGLPAGPGPDTFPLGVEPNRKSLGMIIKYAAQQGLIPRPYSVDELFDDVTRVLGK
jgi:4,5-dihydroxyphthalate decarboxylase